MRGIGGRKQEKKCLFTKREAGRSRKEGRKKGGREFMEGSKNYKEVR
jgi:hypothetical protein